MRRVAGIWNRPTLPVEKGGAALGAAVAGVKTLYDANADMEAEPFDVEAFSASVLKRGKSIDPNPVDVAAYHGEGKYLQRFVKNMSGLWKNTLYNSGPGQSNAPKTTRKSYEVCQSC